MKSGIAGTVKIRCKLMQQAHMLLFGLKEEGKRGKAFLVYIGPLGSLSFPQDETVVTCCD